MSVDRGGEGTPPSPAAPSSGASPVPPADAELIGRMRDGDDSAYEELFRRHSGAVRRYARTCCRDAHTADDLTAEVFARMLQAVRGGSGPAHAVRPYLLTTVRRVAARWTASARREQLVEDFAVFAAQASASARRYPGREAPGDTAGPGAGSLGVDTELGADVRAMHAAEQSLAVRAFRSLPERWQAVLWHTEVEDESPSEVAVLFGLDANGTRVLASRAREGLRQAYLQAHVSESLAGDEVCARYAGQLGAHVRGRLRTRAERGCASISSSARGAGWRRRRSGKWRAASRRSCRWRSSAGSGRPGTGRSRGCSRAVERRGPRRAPAPRPGPVGERARLPPRGWGRR